MTSINNAPKERALGQDRLYEVLTKTEIKFFSIREPGRAYHISIPLDSATQLLFHEDIFISVRIVTWFWDTLQNFSNID